MFGLYKKINTKHEIEHVLPLMTTGLNQAIYVQIKNLVQGLVNKKSVRSSKTDMISLVEIAGTEAEKYMFICLFESIDFKDPKIQNGTKDLAKTQFLSQHLTIYSSQSAFLDYFAQVIEATCQKQTVREYISDISKCLKLTLPMQIIIAISLYLSSNKQTSRDGQTILKLRLTEYYKSGKTWQFPESAYSILLYILQSSTDFEDLKDELKFLIDTNSNSSSDLKPLLFRGIENIPADEGTNLNQMIENFVPFPVRLREVVKDLGPTCTQSLQSIRQVLSDFPKLDEEDVLQTLLMMCNNATEIENQNVRTMNSLYQAIKAKSKSQLVEDTNDKVTDVTWNFENFIKACIEKRSNLKWPRIINGLDCPNLFFKSPQDVLAFFKVFKKLPKNQTFQFPTSIFFESWKNLLSQANFLVNVIQAGQPDAVFFSQPKKSPLLDNISNLKNLLQNTPALQFFTSLDILKLLLELSETGYYLEIRALFDLPLQKCPDLLTYGLIQIQPEAGSYLLNELYNQLLPNYISNPSSSAADILHNVWKNKPQLLVSVLSEQYQRDPNLKYLLRVLEIAEKIPNSLPTILESNNDTFALSLALCAVEKKKLEFEPWLNEKLQSRGESFILSLIRYLEQKLIVPCSKLESGQSLALLQEAQLNVTTLASLLVALNNSRFAEAASEKTKQLMIKSYKQIVDYFPEIAFQASKPEMETEANRYLEECFQEKLTVSELSQKLLGLKNSATVRDKDLFLCIMTNLLDESRFFVNYKQKILLIMAEIYGTIIQNNIIEGQARELAFKIVLEAMKTDKKQLLEFGAKAVETFKNRLPEWPSKALQIFSIENLWNKYSSLLEDIRSNFENKGINIEIPSGYINYLEQKKQEKPSQLPNSSSFSESSSVQEPLQSQEILAFDQDSGLKNRRFSNSRIEEMSQNFGSMVINSNLLAQSTPLSASSPQPNFNMAQEIYTPFQDQFSGTPNSATLRSPDRISRTQPVTIDGILKSYDVEFTDVSEDLKSKLVFSLNNCSNTNLDEKTIEIRKLLNENPQLVPWISKHIVFQRAPIELNFHTMYINLLEKLSKPELFKEVTRETYSLLRRLLDTDRVVPGVERNVIQLNDKTVLKNLGSWLGLLTLARNKPIILKEFDIKGIIVEGYENKKLDYILPLVCKILTHGSQPGSVFKPKNAWMNAVLSILVEISGLPEIKMALKCEIQVLLNNLGILNEAEIIPSKIIHTRNANRANQTLAESTEDQSGIGINLYSIEGQLAIHELPQYVTIDNRLLEGINLPNLKAVVAQALDNAIKEILPPVISRSVTIALITAKELVLKDFALEPDENKLLRGANLIVQNLAGNLALVTCREPLKMAFQQNLKSSFDQVELDERAREEIIHATSVDNLDLGCALIKKAVIEKAIDEVSQDPIIVEAIEKRRIAAQKGVPFYDENIVKIYASLPAALRPSSGGLSRDQISIYEEFGKFARNQQTVTTPKESRHPALDGRSAERRLDSEALAVVMRFEQYILLLDKELNTLAEQPNPEKLKELQTMYKKVMELVGTSPNRDNLVIECAIKILDPLFNDLISIKKINFFLLVLRELKNLNSYLTSFLLQWILLPTEKRILKSDIILKLIKDSFFSIKDLDQGFSSLLETANSFSNDKASNVVHIYLGITKIIKSLIIDEKFLPATAFNRTIEFIFRSIKNFKETYPKMGKYLEDFKNAIAETFGSNSYNTINPIQMPTDEEYRVFVEKALSLFSSKESEHYDQAFAKFVEWLKITSEKEMPSFIKILETTIFQAQQDKFTKFFAFMTDICVNHSLDSINKISAYKTIAQATAMDFSYIDAYSKLIIVILKTVINTDKNQMFENILESSILTLTKNHELHRANFNQRPFFRLFFNLIFDIQRKEYNFNNEEIAQFTTIFISVFEKLQPLRFPGFSFSWLQLIFNPNFISLTLANTENKNQIWHSYSGLIACLFRFFRETINKGFYKNENYKSFYKATMRALLILLHDFPEFLVETSFVLIESLPEKLNHIRNVILSAAPRSIPSPDPFRVNSQIELNEEYKTIPETLFDFEERVVSIKFHEEIFKYLKSDESSLDVYFRNICSKLLTKDDSGDIKINYPVVNAFILYMPTMVYKSSDDENKVKQFKLETYDLLLKLLVSSNPVMREALLNAILNQIRYPNLITFYFTGLIIYIFAKQADETLLEQIMRIFIQRLVIEKPRPWGIIYAFIELIKDKELVRKKAFFRSTELEEITKYIFEVMGKGEERAEN